MQIIFLPTKSLSKCCQKYHHESHSSLGGEFTTSRSKPICNTRLFNSVSRSISVPCLKASSCVPLAHCNSTASVGAAALQSSGFPSGDICLFYSTSESNVASMRRNGFQSGSSGVNGVGMLSQCQLNSKNRKPKASCLRARRTWVGFMTSDYTETE